MMGLTLSASNPRYLDTAVLFILFATFLTVVAVQARTSTYDFYPMRRAVYRGRSAPISQQLSSSETEMEKFYKRNFPWGKYGQARESAGGSRGASQEEDDNFENKECCPSVTELIHPLAGVSRDGMILEIYRGENKTQKFYQTSCRREFKDKPCRFVRQKHGFTSRCKQEYSYTYAIVRDVNTDGQWRMDHIRVRSGCICKVTKTGRGRSAESRGRSAEIRSRSSEAREKRK